MEQQPEKEKDFNILKGEVLMRAQIMQQAGNIDTESDLIKSIMAAKTVEELHALNWSLYNTDQTRIER